MTVPAGTLLPGTYDPLVVTLSIVIAVTAAYAALDLSGRVTVAKSWPFAIWLLGGSMAMAIGIWSMHFTGMLAFHLPVPVSYHWPTVLLSYVVAFLASLLALFVVSRRKMSTARAWGSGVAMGCGIAGLHYLDMFGMRMPADMRFSLILVALSVALAMTFSYSAMRLAFRFRDVNQFEWRKIGGAFVMGAAISGMHYTGMSAATFTASGLQPDFSRSVSVSSLATTGIIIVTLLVMAVAIVSSFVDRRFQAQSLQVALAETKLDFAYLGRAASLVELAASIAHEINQPLGAVVNSASAALRWLAMQPPDVEEARQAASQTVREANRASEVVARVRALLRKEQPQMHRVDINQVVQEALNLTGNEIAKGRVDVKTELAPEMPTVSGDPVQLQQVMFNLIMNAIEAMSVTENRLRELVIKSTISDGNVQVSVQDSGVGLKSEDLDRVFRPFFTTKPKGIGMGLSISRSIIEAHGGRLWAASRDSAGAVFHFTVPKAEATG